MSRLLIRLLVVVAILGAGASLATAQSLAGTVRDSSGAVLPGVTIEASSPALITKVRTGVSERRASVAAQRPSTTSSPRAAGGIPKASSSWMG